MKRVDAEVWALLDDSAEGRSRLYTEFVREHRCVLPQELEAVWAQVAADQEGGLHAVLLADYEWGVALQRGVASQAQAGSLRLRLRCA
ncbi:hypothetical protein [Ideonella paludis]|uniref:hypothetical protein n=1 Tax=Ideonella paludis TaxID=1233411 RepID=UPI00362D043B